MVHEEYIDEEVWNPDIDQSKGHVPDDHIDTSDPIVIDRKPYVPSPMLDIYGDGHKFDIFDNQNLYMIVKIIKDYVDRQIYIRDIAYKLGVKNRQVIFSMVTQPHAPDMDYYLQNFASRIKADVVRLIGDYFIFKDKVQNYHKAQKELILIIREKDDAEVKEPDEERFPGIFK